MAQGQLNRTVELASMLKKEFDVNTDLPEWVESKITKAEDYLSTVFDYMRGKEGIGEGKLTEGKFQMKGKYLTMPSGEVSSIPGKNDRDAIIVQIKYDMFSIITGANGKPYAYGPKYDKSFKNGNDLAKWLNKEKAKYQGIDNR